MALKEAYMQHRETGSAGGEIELKPDEDESYLIKSVQVDTVSAFKHFLELKTGRTTVGYISVGKQKTNHILYDKTNSFGKNIIEELREKGVNVDYPVSTGETFVVRNLGAGQEVVIIYEVYDEGDRKKDEVNGSESKEYYQLNYGYISAAEIKKKEYCLIGASFLPKEMVNFPFGQVVPAKTEIDIIGLFGIPSSFGFTSNNSVYTVAIKLIRERTTLFTKQIDCFNFIPSTKNSNTQAYDYGNSQIGFGYDTHEEDVFYPPKPITFYGGEELGIYVKLSDVQSSSASGLVEEAVRVGVIERIRKV